MLIKQIVPIDLHWPTIDPFLFCAHHDDHFPKGNHQLGVDQHFFAGRQMGSDFEVQDGFRLYHGHEVPGFPVHPHRGFETITIVRKGYVDHADSLGAAGRYGEGDVQWLTAGAGVQHSEMFPLVHTESENPTELFQIWLNLPKKNKMVKPDFKMIWSEKIPTVQIDTQGSQVKIICGEYGDINFNEAPPQSYASFAQSGVRILLVKLQKNSQFNLPKCALKAERLLYFFNGVSIHIGETKIHSKSAVHLDSQQDLGVTTESAEVEFLILEAVPLREPVAQHGPFVMNTREEIVQAFSDYQKTHFGGWPWNRDDMVHGEKPERFAKYPDGRIEKP